MQRNVALTLLLCVVSVIALCEGSLLIRTCNFDEPNQDSKTVQQTIIELARVKIEDMLFEETESGKSINVTVTNIIGPNLANQSIKISMIFLNDVQIMNISKIMTPGEQATIGFQYNWVAGYSYNLVMYVTKEEGSRFIIDAPAFHAVAPCE